MIQLNLLPASKLDNLKARRSEHLVLVGSIIASLISVGLFILALAAVGFQKYSLNSASSSITSYQSQFDQLPDVNNVLTLQNQLKTLVSLHANKPAVTRLFTYLTQITPTQASISQLTVNFDNHTMTVSGTANSLQAVTEFADTLKFTTYTTSSQKSAKPAFTSVSLSNFGRDSHGASYNFSLSYDPALFNIAHDVALSVPQNYITTRSFTQLPNSSLFAGGNSEGQ